VTNGRVPLHTAPLGQLLPSLRQALHEVPPGAWVHRRLSRGAVVSMCATDKYGGRQRMLLLSRPKSPVDNAGMEAWQREVNLLLEYLGATRWEPSYQLPPGSLAGVDAAVWNLFVEPVHRRLTRMPQ
jgi:hypothetical protein